MVIWNAWMISSRRSAVSQARQHSQMTAANMTVNAA
jgi:hypothetical protein